MKTSRSDPGSHHRFSLYGSCPMPEKSGEKHSAKSSLKGILKRVGAAMRRSERRTANSRRSAGGTGITPLLGRAKYALKSKLSRLQNAMAKRSSAQARGRDGAGAAAQQAPAATSRPLSGAQLAALHAIAVDDIKKLILEFSDASSDVPAAVAKMNALSNSLRESRIGLTDLTYDQITIFLEKAEACTTPALNAKARDFLLRAQSTAPEKLETVSYVTYAPAPE